ncbi:MAG: hypothetical protein ACOX8H_04250 [Ruminococcus sp.]|jgi:hypothetical protein
MMENWYVLSPGELTVLAAGMGIGSFYGLEFDPPDFDRNSYLDLIYQMTKKGLLTARENRVEAAEEMKRLFGPLRDGGRILLCMPAREIFPAWCCYCTAGQVTVTEKSPVDRDKIRLCAVENRERAMELLMETYFPEKIAETADMLAVETKTEEFGGVFPPAEEVLKDEKVRMVMDALDPADGGVCARLCITKHPFGYEILYQGEQEEKCFFGKDRMKKYLNRMTGGG